MAGGFRFVHSPSVKDGKTCFESDDKNTLEKNLIDIRYECKKYKDQLEVKPCVSDGKFKVYKGDTVYYPVFIAEITVENLYKIALELSNYLAQGAKDHWDGETVTNMIA